MFTIINASRVSAVLIAVYVVSLIFGYGRDNGWLIEADGHKRTIEFVAVRAAGEQAAAGVPAAAYDWAAHRVVHDRVIGRPPNGSYYPWPYPPPYLIVAQALSYLPYVPSALLLIAVTLAGFAFVARQIVGTNAAMVWAIAAPPSFINASVAHTGFLVGGLFGGALAALRSRPLLSGVLFGLLAVKPQLGLLIPMALVAGGHWRTIGAAAATVAAMIAVSVLFHGLDPWLAFPAQLDRVADVFREGRVNFAMLVTVYGLLRWAEVPHAVAFATQVAVSLTLAVAVFRLWRSDASSDLKAAGLVVASLLATPYLFLYDLTLLTVAILFLVRHVGADHLDRVELAAIMAGGTLVFLFASIPFPVGLLCNLAAGVLVWRRVYGIAPAAVPTPAAA